MFEVLRGRRAAMKAEGAVNKIGLVLPLLCPHRACYDTSEYSSFVSGAGLLQGGQGGVTVNSLLNASHVTPPLTGADPALRAQRVPHHMFPGSGFNCSEVRRDTVPHHRPGIVP